MPCAAKGEPIGVDHAFKDRQCTTAFLRVRAHGTSTIAGGAFASPADLAVLL